MKKIFLLYVYLFSFQSIFANSSIAPYILDGSLVLYFPNIREAEKSWKTLYQKTTGVEAVRIISNFESQIRYKMSVNILNPQEAESIGIDSMGPVSYVHLRKNVGYAVFKIKNEKLVRFTLDNLPIPVPYRIEGQFIIFSSSIEILQYKNFKGVKVIPEFNQFVSAANISWNEKFVWVHSSFFTGKQFSNSLGEYIGGVFEINSNNMGVNLYTFYFDKRIRNLLRESMKIKPAQRMTLFDYMPSNQGTSGQIYADMAKFCNLVRELDIADTLNLTGMFAAFKSKGIDLKTHIIPDLQGRLSYVVRKLDFFQRQFDFIITSSISDKQKLKKYLKEAYLASRFRGAPFLYKNLFTQEFFGIPFSNITIWIGIAEDHLVIASEEKSLESFVQNIYQEKSGFLNTLPSSFRVFSQRKIVGGQMYIIMPEFLQNIRFNYVSFPFTFLSSVKTAEWNFSVVEDQANTIRKDTVLFNFY
ncbi:MAG: hypothetical protein ACRCTQ_02575 [Brevinemataceae bacterium]